MIKNIKIIGLLVAIISMVSVQGQSNDDEFVKFLENKEIKKYSMAGRALMDYYEKIDLMGAIEGKEGTDFSCEKVPVYQKEIENLKLKIENKKTAAESFVEKIEEPGDEKKKEHFERLNDSYDVIVNQYDLGLAGYIHDNCE